MEKKQSEFRLQISDGEIIRKCQICGHPSFSFPLQIVHNLDNSTLCTVHSEAYAGNLHEAVHLYLDRYPHHLRKIETHDGHRYTLIIGFNETVENSEVFNIGLSEVGTFFAVMADQYNISSLYYIPGTNESVGGIKYKHVNEDAVEETEFLLFTTGNFFHGRSLNSVLLIDEVILDFNNEWQFMPGRTNG